WVTIMGASSVVNLHPAGPEPRTRFRHLLKPVKSYCKLPPTEDPGAQIPGGSPAGSRRSPDPARRRSYPQSLDHKAESACILTPPHLSTVRLLTTPCACSHAYVHGSDWDRSAANRMVNITIQ